MSSPPKQRPAGRGPPVRRTAPVHWQLGAGPPAPRCQRGRGGCPRGRAGRRRCRGRPDRGRPPVPRSRTGRSTGRSRRPRWPHTSTSSDGRSATSWGNSIPYSLTRPIHSVITRRREPCPPRPRPGPAGCRARRRGGAFGDRAPGGPPGPGTPGPAPRPPRSRDREAEPAPAAGRRGFVGSLVVQRHGFRTIVAGPATAAHPGARPPAPDPAVQASWLATRPSRMSALGHQALGEAEPPHHGIEDQCTAD